MKKCRRCQKPATLHITEVRKGDVTEIHLCETCARDYLDQPESGEEPAGEFEFEKLPETESDDTSAVDDRACPHCSISFREFRSQGRLGCPYCYVEFEADLIPLLENIHGEVQHCGKLPRRAPDSSRRIQHGIRSAELAEIRAEIRLSTKKTTKAAAATAGRHSGHRIGAGLASRFE